MKKKEQGEVGGSGVARRAGKQNRETDRIGHEIQHWAGETDSEGVQCTHYLMRRIASAY